MLKTFFVKDYVLIDSVSVEFRSGLNIITGETGAGKSILIDAMGLLLGERASVEVVRKGASKAIIEGIFDISLNKKITSILSANDFETSGELILRREISVSGNNRCFINDSPASLSLIKELGNLLVDLHGQHQHQSLLRTETHIEFLDQYAGLTTQAEEYHSLYFSLLNKISFLNNLHSREKEIKEKRDFYSFQAMEIDSIDPLPDEEDELNSELKILENSERLTELTNEIYEQSYDSDDSVYDRMVLINSRLSELQKIDSSFDEVFNESENAVNLLKDISEFIRSYKSKIALDPERLENIRERLSALQMLKKKFGGSIQAVINYRKKIGGELSLAENFSDRILQAEEEINELRSTCGAAAGKLSVSRSRAAEKVKKIIAEYLSELGIEKADFGIRLERRNAEKHEQQYVIYNGKNFISSGTGIDFVEFFISTNPGEDLKPLVKVASGGEISRIMLALKSALAKSEKLPLLIFDEIDTGVSGRIAQKVGNVLKSLSALHQIIAITHLPQIAGKADVHFSIEKAAAGERVVSSVKVLSDEERISEVAKLMSGEKVTEASLNGAKELMDF